MVVVNPKIAHVIVSVVGRENIFLQEFVKQGDSAPPPPLVHYRLTQITLRHYPTVKLHWVHLSYNPYMSSNQYSLIDHDVCF